MVAQCVGSICISVMFFSILLAGAVSPAVSSERPAAFTYPVGAMGSVAPVVPAPIDLNAALAEDRRRPADGPSRFAISRPVQITPQRDGLWEDLDGDTCLWRIPVVSPGALSLSLGFSRCHLPPGGRLFVYSDDHSQVVGPFTSRDNRAHGELWTPVIRSDSLVVELTIPTAEIPALELELGTVNHGYRGYGLSLQCQAQGEAGWCNQANNAACYQGQWGDQIRSVAYCHVTVGGATWEGTGTLVNNTAGNGIPYFLTAFHLFDKPRDGVLTSAEKAADRTLVVYWNFQAASCTGATGSLSQSQQGATLKAAHSSCDFVLVELDRKPAPACNVYYAGWDRNSTSPSGGVAIHHPKGDLKKISRAAGALRKQTNTVSTGGVSNGTCFFVDAWEPGTGMVEHGSSGCPFFNSSGKRMVGQLVGGLGSCDDPGPAGFGPLYRSWSEGGTPQTRLKDWLDPGNTGTLVLDGRNAAGSSTSGSVDLVAVAGAPYAPLDGLAPGSKGAQDNQRRVVEELGLPLEVRTRETGIAFRLVPPGIFAMGSLKTEPGRAMDESPQHLVILTKPLWCGKFEVTQGQWQQVMGSSPAGGAGVDPDTPVSLVFWDECQDFVRKLCQIEGVPEGTYRLLTEAEWEYACRAGTVGAYCCGDTEYALAQYAWYLVNGGSQLHPVGQKKANAFGLHDMHGNVWEWCQDWWSIDYPHGTVTNPTGPTSGGSRVFRGGALNDNAKICRSAERNKSSPTFGYGNVGLRLAREVPSGLGSLSGKLTVLTFEGIATNDNPWIPDGYGELSWSGSFCVHSPGGAAVSGYVNGTVSPVSAAYNGGAYAVECSGSSFTFVGAYLTGAWRDDLQIEISGYRSGSRLYHRVVSVNSQYPTWCRFDYEDVDRVTFASSGGRHNGVFTSDGAQFVMDDMVIRR